MDEDEYEGCDCEMCDGIWAPDDEDDEWYDYEGYDRKDNSDE